jgi:hypothetical protein
MVNGVYSFRCLSSEMSGVRNCSVIKRRSVVVLDASLVCSMTSFNFVGCVAWKHDIVVKDELEKMWKDVFAVF